MTRRFLSEPSTGYTYAGAESKSAELRTYQTFMFTVPILFILIVAFMLYMFYLYHRRRRVDLLALRVQVSQADNVEIPRQVELGLKKELREMLPIIVYKESFTVNDTQCAVCLGDYQPEDKLQQIPACGHAFHMECIDSWLANHVTCPLCRLSLLPSPKTPTESQDDLPEIVQESSAAQDSDETSIHLEVEPCEESQHTMGPQLRNEESRTIHNNSEEEGKTSKSADQFMEGVNARSHNEVIENTVDVSAA